MTNTPFWMKNPLPEEDRVRWNTRDAVMRRLKDGEQIKSFQTFGTAGNIYPRMIHFKGGGRLDAVRAATFDSLKRHGIIEQVLSYNDGLFPENGDWALRPSIPPKDV